MKTVNDVLFYTSDLTLDEARRVIENFRSVVNSIGDETKTCYTDAAIIQNIANLVEQAEEQNKRILKRLLK